MTGAKSNIEAIYPLSPMQEGILFHTLYAPESSLYIEQYSCDLDGALDVASFKAAWGRVIARHPVLRSLLTWEGRTNPLQIVRQTVDPVWYAEDLRKSAPGELERHVASYLEADRVRGFVLDQAPLVRFALLRIAEQTHRFVWTFHHVILDGWSMRIVLDEVFRCYKDLVSGREPTLPAVPPFRNYINWLLQQSRAADERHWRRELAGFTTQTSLRLEQTNMGSRWAERHQEHEVSLSEADTARVTLFAREHRLTLNTVLQGAWALVVSRYSGKDDVVFGATVSGRPTDLAGVAEMVGLFINTIPVRVQVPANKPVIEWLQNVQRRHLENSAFDSTSLAAIQEWSEVAKGHSLFDTLLVIENLPDSSAGEPHDAGLRVSDARYVERSNYPMAVLVVPGQALRMIMVYDEDRYDAALVSRLANQLMRTLQALVEMPDQPVRALPFFPAAELKQIVVEWNETETDRSRDRRVHDLIADRVRETPDGVAAVFEGRELTYGTLDERAELVAQQLRTAGVGPDRVVGICVERSLGMVVGILGVLKAGGAYVPLDPRLPSGRVQFLLEDTEAAALLTDASGKVHEDHTHRLPVWSLDADGRVEARSAQVLHAQPDTEPSHLAYVMYTSGSTGKPKGVAVTHRNLVNSTEARRDYYAERVSKYLLLSPFVFDSSVAGIFWTLSQGGALVLPSPKMEQDVKHLARLIETQQVSHVLLLPTLYDLLLEHARPTQLESLRVVIVAGEPCPPGVVERHAQLLPPVSLYNEYGPTESTVWCTVHHVTPPAIAPSGPARMPPRVPIGRPIANTQVYLLDEAGRPVPVGVPGHLHVGGDNLAREYLNQPALTDQAFVEHDIPLRGRVRLYRTGDIARHFPDGSIDILGRADHQVKIRGQRIELGEIEGALREHPSVRDAVALVRSSQSSTDGESTDTLLTMLETLSESVALRLVSDVEQLSDDEAEESLTSSPLE